MKFQIRAKDQTHAVEVIRSDNRFEVILDGRRHDVSLIFSDVSHDVLLVNNTCYDVVMMVRDGRYQADVISHYFDLEVVDPRRGLRQSGTQADGERRSVIAHMPGRIVKILVKEGDPVQSGQGLLVLEAMKMQNELKAPRDGVVSSIAIKEGDAVEAGKVLIGLE